MFVFWFPKNDKIIQLIQSYKSGHLGVHTTVVSLPYLILDELNHLVKIWQGNFYWIIYVSTFYLHWMPATFLSSRCAWAALPNKPWFWANSRAFVSRIRSVPNRARFSRTSLRLYRTIYPKNRCKLMILLGPKRISHTCAINMWDFTNRLLANFPLIDEWNAIICGQCLSHLKVSLSSFSMSLTILRLNVFSMLTVSSWILLEDFT